MHSKQASTAYPKQKPMTESQILEKAAEILAGKYVRQDVLCNPQATMDYLSFKLGGYG